MNPIELIRDCVRGIQPWTTLEHIGIKIEQSGDTMTFTNPGKHVFQAFPEDIAEGFGRVQADPERLRQWAQILLCGSGFIDLKSEDHGYGELLLEGLWDASGGEPVRESAVLAARELYTG